MGSNGTSAEKLRTAAGSGTLCQADGSDSEVEDPPGSRSHTGVNPTMMNPGFGGRQRWFTHFLCPERSSDPFYPIGPMMHSVG